MTNQIIEDQKNAVAGNKKVDTTKEKVGNKIVLQSAKGQWSEALKKLFECDYDKNFIVAHWNMSMEKNKETQNNHKILKKSISKIATDKNVHIFVAPITWAQKFSKRRNYFIIGPSFATIDDLVLIARKKWLTNKDDKIAIDIHTIDEDITSSISLKLLLHFLENEIQIKIHKFFIDIVKDETINNIINDNNDKSIIDIQRMYYFDSENDKKERMDTLLQDQSSIDLAIFTRKELKELLEKQHEYVNQIYELLTIENSLINQFKISYLPRSVYCIHKSQINCDFYDLFKIFYDKIGSIFKNNDAITKPNITVNNIFPISPYSNKYRNAQEEFIKKASELNFLNKESFEFSSCKEILETMKGEKK